MTAITILVALAQTAIALYSLTNAIKSSRRTAELTLEGHMPPYLVEAIASDGRIGNPRFFSIRILNHGPSPLGYRGRPTARSDAEQITQYLVPGTAIQLGPFPAPEGNHGPNTEVFSFRVFGSARSVVHNYAVPVTLTAKELEHDTSKWILPVSRSYNLDTL